MSNLLAVRPVQQAGNRHQNQGCWTGWVADMQMIRSISTKSQPQTYLEHYPRNRASSLNTWLSRFGIYTNGMFFELDRKGTCMVKEILKRSANARGFMIRVDGVRKGDTLQVISVREIAKEPLYTDPDLQRIAQSQLRGEFAKMGI
jgi:hypothetical protein